MDIASHVHHQPRVATIGYGGETPPVSGFLTQTLIVSPSQADAVLIAGGAKGGKQEEMIRIVQTGFGFCCSDVRSDSLLVMQGAKSLHLPRRDRCPLENLASCIWLPFSSRRISE